MKLNSTFVTLGAAATALVSAQDVSAQTQQSPSDYRRVLNIYAKADTAFKDIQQPVCLSSKQFAELDQGSPQETAARQELDQLIAQTGARDAPATFKAMGRFINQRTANTAKAAEAITGKDERTKTIKSGIFAVYSDIFSYGTATRLVTKGHADDPQLRHADRAPTTAEMRSNIGMQLATMAAGRVILNKQTNLCITGDSSQPAAAFDAKTSSFIVNANVLGSRGVAVMAASSLAAVDLAGKLVTGKSASISYSASTPVNLNDSQKALQSLINERFAPYRAANPVKATVKAPAAP